MKLTKNTLRAKGQIYGKLLVLDVFRKDSTTWAGCECKCGSYCEVRLNDIRSGSIVSCGCQKKSNAIKLGSKYGKLKRIHGESRSIEGVIWRHMMHRCYNENHPGFKNWGGRGIRVHKPWRSKRNGCKRFIKWLLSDDGIGRRPSNKYSLDRYPDNNGNYEPGNLRWATKKQQIHNRRPILSKKDRKLILSVFKQLKRFKKLTLNELVVYKFLKIKL